MTPADHVTRGEVTRLLDQATLGDAHAANSLFAIVYDDLRRVAASALRRERTDHTLQPTALVHEVYLRLADTPDGQWRNRAHFLAIAARAMRRVLVDHARGHNAQKRGSGETPVPLEDVDVAAPMVDLDVDLVALDEALGRLGRLDPRQARVVELRFFGGLTVEETAEVIDTSTRTVKREWQVARIWLKREMSRLNAADA
jgi:RNA polymerase sigma-70 factor, ECF subfamily